MEHRQNKGGLPDFEIMTRASTLHSIFDLVVKFHNDDRQWLPLLQCSYSLMAVDHDLWPQTVILCLDALANEFSELDDANLQDDEDRPERNSSGTFAFDVIGGENSADEDSHLRFRPRRLQ